MDSGSTPPCEGGSRQVTVRGRPGMACGFGDRAEHGSVTWSEGGYLRTVAVGLSEACCQESPYTLEDALRVAEGLEQPS